MDENGNSPHFYVFFFIYFSWSRILWSLMPLKVPLDNNPFPPVHWQHHTAQCHQQTHWWVHSIPPSMSPVKMLHCTGPSRDPWGISLIFMFTLSRWPRLFECNHPIHQLAPSLNSCLSNLETMMPRGMVSNILRKSKWMTSHNCNSFIHQCWKPITKDHQICQALFTLSEAIFIKEAVTSFFSMCNIIVSRKTAVILSGIEIRETSLRIAA